MTTEAQASEQATVTPECGSPSPITRVPCRKPPGHNPDEGHNGGDVEMPDGRVIPGMSWGATRH